MDWVEPMARMEARNIFRITKVGIRIWEVEGTC
jgi:hypothetical protein